MNRGSTASEGEMSVPGWHFNGDAGRPARPAVVFDIGGTWFRRAVWTADRTLVDPARQPALNYLSTPHRSCAELQRGFIDYVIEQVDQVRRTRPEVETAAISLGAALNGNTGEVLQASPIWGPHSGGFPVLESLAAGRPQVRWAVVNDVTAALLRHVWSLWDELRAAQCRRVALFTISTGIAARTFDLERRAVPVDRAHGVQGEVGHLAIDFRFEGRPFAGTCDCGGRNHVNAFASGRGIERTAREICAAYPERYRASLLAAATSGESSRLTFADLAAALEQGDEFASAILDAACGPIADLIVHQLTFDPEVERVFMIGGVVAHLGGLYMSRLHEALERRGFYQVSPRDPSFFRRRVVQGFCDDQSGLIGAGIYAGQTGAQPDPRTDYLRTVRSEHRLRYDVGFAPGLLDPDNPALLRVLHARPGDRRLMFVDAGADEHHGDDLRAYFAHHGIEAHAVTLTTSERGKTLDAVRSVVNEFAKFGVLRRSEPVLAAGGGILTDVVGFAASVYRRGIPYVRVPTTLMGMVDAGIGVKTGVTLNGKNRIGSYHPPLHVVIDLSFLRTVDQRYLRSGVAEIVKIALVRERELFEDVEAHLAVLLDRCFQDGEVAGRVVRASVHAMLDELEPNLLEHELRRRADFGHTFSPEFEVASGLTLLHGEAVALDMALCAVLSNRRSLISDRDLARILALLGRSGLPLWHEILDPALLSRALGSTMEHRDGRQRVPLLSGIGSVTFVEDLTVPELAAALDELCTSHRADVG
jgi:3-dehydroquinate synthetase/predicted NBD/HSP70 family sugar kinase